MQGKCPICKRDGFTANPESGSWACAACGDRGSGVVSLEVALYDEDFEEARAYIASLVRSPGLTSAPDPPLVEGQAAPPVGSKPAESWGSESGHPEGRVSRMTPRETVPPPKAASILTPDVAAIPEELSDIPAWVGWRRVERKGRWTKEPVNI